MWIQSVVAGADEAASAGRCVVVTTSIVEAQLKVVSGAEEISWARCFSDHRKQSI